MNSEEDVVNSEATYDVTLVLDGYQFFNEKNVKATDRLNAMVNTINRTALVIKGHLLESTEMTVVVKKQKIVSDKTVSMPFPDDKMLNKQFLSSSIS